MAVKVEGFNPSCGYRSTHECSAYESGLAPGIRRRFRPAILPTIRPKVVLNLHLLGIGNARDA